MQDISLFATALWLGILMSISPCPLTSNIAAISYLSKNISKDKSIFVSGLMYIAGRSIIYILIAFITVKIMMDVSAISGFLEKYMNKILGFILIFAGMMMLDMVALNIPGIYIGKKGQKKLAGMNEAGAFLLGIVFALAFCPVSAALFFGGLLPVAIKAKSAFVMPLLFGIGTGVPVVIASVILNSGVKRLMEFNDKMQVIGSYAKQITGIIFIAAGIYYILSYVFEVF